MLCFYSMFILQYGCDSCCDLLRHDGSVTSMLAPCVQVVVPAKYGRHGPKTNMECWSDMPDNSVADTF